MVRSVLKRILKGLNIILQKYKNLKTKDSICYTMHLLNLAGWQSGYAAACKAVYAGSIPASASNVLKIVNIIEL